MSEDWKVIPGWDGYEVSSDGRVRSLDRMDSRGRRRRGRMLSLARQQSGHLVVAIYANGHRRSAGVHALVLEAFVGPRPDGMECLHWNDVPDDNRLENLRWGTRSENILDSVRNGTHHMSVQTHCPRGHEYTPDNTYLYPQGNRACNECRREYRERNAERRRSWNRDYMRRKRAAARSQRELEEV